jgi:hypothetical protein
MQKLIVISILYNTHLHLHHIRKKKLNRKAKIIHIPTKGPSGYIDLPYKLPNSLLIKGIRMREASKLGWVIEFAKHVWAAIIFHYQIPGFIPAYLMTFFIVQETVSEVVLTVTKPHGSQSAYFTNLASATFAWNTADIMCLVKSQFLKRLHADAMIGDRDLLIAMPSSCLKKVGGCQANFQQLDNIFDLEDVQFHHGMVFAELISDDLEAPSTGTLAKRLKISKLTNMSRL